MHPLISLLILCTIYGPLPTCEQSIRSDPTEHLIISKHGIVYNIIDGNYDSVFVSSDLAALYLGYDFTHNHPAGLQWTFSPDDLYFGYFANAAFIRVVSSGYTCTVSRGPGVLHWPTIDKYWDNGMRRFRYVLDDSIVYLRRDDPFLSDEQAADLVYRQFFDYNKNGMIYKCDPVAP